MTDVFMLIFTGFALLLSLVAIILSVVAIINTSNIPEPVDPNVPPNDNPPDNLPNSLFYKTITFPILPSNYFQYEPGQMILEQVLGSDLNPIPTVFLSGDGEKIYYNMETFISNDFILQTETPRIVQTVYGNLYIVSRTNLGNEWLDWGEVRLL